MSIAKNEAYENFLKASQPNDKIRELVRTSLNTFCTREKIDLSLLSKSTQMAAIAGFLRIGIAVSKDTVYPVIRGSAGNKTVMIQDNYLFLQRLILNYTGATHLVIDLIYKDEFKFVENITITRNFNKNEVIPLKDQTKNTTLDNVHSVIIGVAGGKVTENTFKVYSRGFLLDRVGSVLFTNREWGFSSKMHKGTGVRSEREEGHKNHKQIEMLKKTAIRAFAKERYGSALELIRTIDIEQSELLKLGEHNE